MSSVQYAPDIDNGAVLAKAVKNAASALGFTQTELADIIGRDRSSLSRGIDPESKSGELARLFIRCYRALHALVGGDTQNMVHWFATNNKHLHGTPKELVHSIQGLVAVLRYLDALRGKV